MSTELTTWKELRHKDDPETGEPLMDEPPVEKEMFELRADGKDVGALDEMIGDVGDIHAQQAYNREKKYGVAVLSDPNGNPVRVLENEVGQYEANGFNKKALKSTFRANGWGGMARDGIRRYVRHATFTETWYRDGRYVIEEIGAST